MTRLSERSASDARLARLEAWWAGLSRREHVLLCVLGILFATLILVYGVVRPIKAERATAIAQIRTYDMLDARILAAGTLRTAPRTPRLEGSPSAIVETAATRQNLSVTTAPTDGGVRVTIANGDYNAVLHWISDVTQNSTLSVVSVDLTRTGTPGEVAGSVDFQP